MIESEPSVCFATLALGKPHVVAAQQLAADLSHYAPQHRLLALTDTPEAFQSSPNVEARPHRQNGVFRCFHDKRFLVKAALDKFEVCIVIDANIRLLAPIRNDIDQTLLPGINAAHLYSIQSKWISDNENREVESEQSRRALDREQRIVTKALDALSISSDAARFPQEYLYAIKSWNRPDQLQDWLDAWGSLAHYFDYHRLPWSEGFGIGIAAAATDVPIECVRVLPDSDYYKERTHLFNLKTFRNPVSLEQEHCHAQQVILKQALAPRFPRAARLYSKLKQASRYGAFRLRHWDARVWLDQIRKRQS